MKSIRSNPQASRNNFARFINRSFFHTNFFPAKIPPPWMMSGDPCPCASREGSRGPRALGGGEGAVRQGRGLPVGVGVQNRRQVTRSSDQGLAFWGGAGLIVNQPPPHCWAEEGDHSQRMVERGGLNLDGRCSAVRKALAPTQRRWYSLRDRGQCGNVCVGPKNAKTAPPSNSLLMCGRDHKKWCL